MIRLIYRFCVVPPTKKPYTPQQQQPNYSFDVISHYDQIAKVRAKSAHISIIPCYPTYTITKTGQVSVRQKYNRNFIYLWRFQIVNEHSQDAAIKEVLNFPISYENAGQLLYLQDQYKNDPTVTLEELTAKGQLTLSVSLKSADKKVNFVLRSQNKEADHTHVVDLNIGQFRILIEQMKQGLPIVTGWNIPHQFITEIVRKDE